MKRQALLVRLESSEAEIAGLQVRRLAASEAVGALYRFEVEVVDVGAEPVVPAELLGIEIDLLFEASGALERRVHGIVSRIADRGDAAGARDASRRSRAMTLTIVPRMHRLTLVATQEVLLDMNLGEVIQKKGDLYGLGKADIELRLAHTYEPREFIVQYKETDLAFLSRLCEHEGVALFFEEKDGRDVLVVGDYEGAFGAVPEHERVAYLPGGGAGGVLSLVAERELVPSLYAMQDYDYRRPLVDLSASASLDVGGGGGVVEYGAHYRTVEEGKRLADIRAEEQRGRAFRYHGSSDRPWLFAGARVIVEGHPDFGDLELCVIEVEHQASLGETGEETSYKNRFVAVPAGFTYRPVRQTPRPRIHGFVTGIVQAGRGGKVGGVAHVDGDGRYLVELHFDTAQKGEARASRPIRMAQPYAGPNHGMHFPLRPGSEVLLAFMDGDPDRPVIMGAVPNAIAPSPVNASNANKNRIVTANGGILIELCDGS